MDAFLSHDIELACKDGKLKCSSHLLAMASPVLEPAIALLKDSQDKVLAMPDGSSSTWALIRDHLDLRMPPSKKGKLGWVGGSGTAGCCMVPHSQLALGAGLACRHGLSTVTPGPCPTDVQPLGRLPFPASPQDNVEPVLELAHKYNMPMVLAACDAFVSSRALLTADTESGEVQVGSLMEWLATADRFGLDATSRQCLVTIRESHCFQGLEFKNAGRETEPCGCQSDYARAMRPDDCLRVKLFDSEYLMQLKPSTLVQLLTMGVLAADHEGCWTGAGGW
jgi:hypothetical protein